jgi:hypothetical protein
VLDTDVLVAAMRSRGGASWQLVDRALVGEFTLLLSVPLVLEYAAILTREEHRKVHRLSVSELDEVINSLVRVAEAVQIRFLWRPLLSDPTTHRSVCSVVPWGRVYCHDAAPKVTGTTRSGRLKSVAEGEAVPDRQRRQGEDTYFPRRIS